jgi:hypothetical protein
MFGDSTTARRSGAVQEPYAVCVQQRLDATGLTLAVANQGVGGNNTRDALALSPKLVVLHSSASTTPTSTCGYSRPPPGRVCRRWTSTPPTSRTPTLPRSCSPTRSIPPTPVTNWLPSY